MQQVNPGDVLFVSCRPGNPNGRRSRAGLLFTVGAEATVKVGAGTGEVSVARAKEILADDGLVVRVESPPPPKATRAQKE